MSIRPPSFDRLVEAIARFPSIGPKTAARIALWLLAQPRSTSEDIAGALLEARDKIKRCAKCFQYAEGDSCPVCSDPARDRSIICVVEEAIDVWSFERTGKFRGLYHVLGGALSPLDGIGPEQLTLAPLFARLHSPEIKEAILALDPDTEGNATALYIASESRAAHVFFTRPAHGLPIGSELAYSDEATLAEAIMERKRLT